MTAALLERPAPIEQPSEPNGFLLLDVDGVLNPLNAFPLPGYRTWQYATPAGRGGPRTTVVRLNPYHGAWLTKLAADLDLQLAWCTPWMGEANRWVGPKVGLLPLPIVDIEQAGGVAPSVGGWARKFAAVIRYAAGRPLIWVDDQFRSPAASSGRDEFWRVREGVKTLLWNVDYRRGLTMRDIEGMRTWWRSN